MKICHYQRPCPYGSEARLGVFFNTSTIVDVNLCWQAYYEAQGIYWAKSKAQTHNPTVLSQTLMLQDNAIEYFQQTLEVFKRLSQKGVLQTRSGAYFSFDLNDEKKTRLHKPLDSIHCYRDFYTHEAHVKKGFEKRAEAMPDAWYELPVYYKGSPAGFIANDEIIPWPSFTEKLDYELELAAVIGKWGQSVKSKDAFQHIFGFTILNDISARDIQKKEMSVRLGPSKGKDFCSVIGPVIVTADEFNYQDPDLLMQARVNGELWSQGHSSEAHYSWSEMIEFMSREEQILPTDLCGSGTVGTGCGLELDRWIQPGDLLELEIEKIGVLKNIVGVPQQGDENGKL